MSVIAIVGAGPGLGLGAARRFGREGFRVALIARTAEKLEALAGELTAEGIDAHGYAGDILDRASLTGALEAAASELGAIDVLQFSPIPQMDYLRPVLETTPDDLAAATAFSIVGLGTAVRQVLPGMEATGRGTIVLVNGNSAVTPNATYAGTSVAFAGESAYGSMLHDALAPKGIHVAQLIVPGVIEGDDPLFATDALAERLWTIHSERGPFRTIVGVD